MAVRPRWPLTCAIWGPEATFVTALSRDAIGEAALRALRGQGGDVSRIERRPEPRGIYSIEAGADQFRLALSLEAPGPIRPRGASG